MNGTRLQAARARPPVPRLLDIYTTWFNNCSNQNDIMMDLSVVRLCEYPTNSRELLNKLDELKHSAFTLSVVGIDYHHNVQSSTEGQGISCLILSADDSLVCQLPFLDSFETKSLPTNDEDFRVFLNNIRSKSTPAARIVMTYSVSSSELLASGSFALYRNSKGFPFHGTITFNNGVPADEIDAHHVSIPLLNQLNWKLSSTMYVMGGKITWRNVHILVIDNRREWHYVTNTFDRILEYGNFSEYFDVWRIHYLLQSTENDKKSLAKPLLQLALNTIRAYLYSDACDPNEANTEANAAIDFLEDAIKRLVTDDALLH